MTQQNYQKLGNPKNIPQMNEQLLRFQNHTQ